MEHSGAVEKLIHEKNQKQKISWHCPFKGLSIDTTQTPLSVSLDSTFKAVNILVN